MTIHRLVLACVLFLPSVLWAQIAFPKGFPQEPFPLVHNELVNEWIRFFQETSEGKLFLAGAVARLPQFEKIIEAKTTQYGVPRELSAVGLVESGYRNLPPEAAKPMHGAGVWMFIASTARAFGLRVDDVVDERLDFEKETDAAMRALSAAHLQFGHWGLSLAAYNEGNEKVKQAIREGGTRDPWQLVREGRLANYLPKVVAAAHLLKGD